MQFCNGCKVMRRAWNWWWQIMSRKNMKFQSSGIDRRSMNDLHEFLGAFDAKLFKLKRDVNEAARREKSSRWVLFRCDFPRWSRCRCRCVIGKESWWVSRWIQTTLSALTNISTAHGEAVMSAKWKCRLFTSSLLHSSIHIMRHFFIFPPAVFVCSPVFLQHHAMTTSTVRVIRRWIMLEDESAHLTVMNGKIIHLLFEFARMKALSVREKLKQKSTEVWNVQGFVVWTETSLNDLVPWVSVLTLLCSWKSEDLCKVCWCKFESLTRCNLLEC